MKPIDEVIFPWFMANSMHDINIEIPHPETNEISKCAVKNT